MKSKNHDLFEHALANPLRVALNVERTGDHGDSYTITLGPGQVRYLNAFDFFGADAEAVIKTIEAASSTVSISSAPWRMRHPDILGNNTVFESEQVDALLKVATWQDRLKVHHALGRLWIQESMPPHV